MAPLALRCGALSVLNRLLGKLAISHCKSVWLH